MRRSGTSPFGCEEAASWNTLVMSGCPLRRLEHAIEDADDERAHDVALEVSAAAMVGARAGRLRGKLCRLSDRVGAERAAGERLRGVGGVDGRAADSRQRDARAADRPT